MGYEDSSEKKILALSPARGARNGSVLGPMREAGLVMGMELSLTPDFPQEIVRSGNCRSLRPSEIVGKYNTVSMSGGKTARARCVRVDSSRAPAGLTPRGRGESRGRPRFPAGSLDRHTLASPRSEADQSRGGRDDGLDQAEIIPLALVRPLRRGLSPDTDCRCSGASVSGGVRVSSACRLSSSCLSSSYCLYASSPLFSYDARASTCASCPSSSSYLPLEREERRERRMSRAKQTT